MPRRFFKKLNRQRHHLRTRWYMKPFEFVFGDPAYWSLNRRNVTRAVALGFFIAFMPPVVPHTPLALLGAIALRVNIPVTLAAIFITNPVTMVPLYYAAYRSGCFVLNVKPLMRLPHQSHDSWLPAFHGPFMEPFIVGCLMLGLAVAVAGYILLGASWHFTLVYKYYKRKRLRRIKEGNFSSL